MATIEEKLFNPNPKDYPDLELGLKKYLCNFKKRFKLRFLPTSFLDQLKKELSIDYLATLPDISQNDLKKIVSKVCKKKNIPEMYHVALADAIRAIDKYVCPLGDISEHSHPENREANPTTPKPNSYANNPNNEYPFISVGALPFLPP